MAKWPLTRHYCMDKRCGWEESSHKLRDGLKCPRCNFLTGNERVIKDKKPNNKS
ncbi:TPA: hypothetical protein ACOQ4X_005890 [Bacillus cereus]|uniref:hypothetical protein n=1 Tax=Bacillus cereus group TaxID=86661 RepID=UPI001484DDFA|nr:MULTISPECIES: hypothetical protein [Bacillus cereus group]MBL3769234.1 hypothetical protein [Bacillus cereus]MBL3775024.1 hypothetical protein [Bacillus cereus]MBL3780831.1 hypothetical protein [Bacillus cereus]MBL3792131.1 hypothetical protein [Bacillus cereus]